MKFNLPTEKGRVQYLMVLALVFGAELAAQSLIFDSYGIRQGLSNRLVRDIETDDRGLVWIATGNGLNRFDGYEFLAFNNSEKAPQEERLSLSNVREISRMADGRLLLLYQDLYSSFDLFDPISHCVEKVEVILADEIDGEPRTFFVNRTGELFVVTEGGTFTVVYRFDPQSEKFEEKRRIFEHWENEHPTISLRVDQTGRFFLFDEEHGLRSFMDGGKETLTSYPQTQPGGELYQGELAIFHEDQKKRLWLSFINIPGVYQLDETQDSLHLSPHFAAEKTYANVWEDQVGNLIFNQADIRGNYPLSRELICLSVEGKQFDFNHLLEVGNYVLDIFSKDFFRSLFIGTDTGLKVVQNTTTRLRRYLSQHIGENRRGYSMRGMCTDKDDNVYFSREVSAWYRLDPATDLIDTILLHDKFGKYLDFNNCQGIWYDTTGYLWGVSGDGTNHNVGYLHHYDIANCTNEIIEYDNSFSAYSTLDQDNFVFGTRSGDKVGGLVFFDRKQGTFDKFLDSKGLNPFEGTHIRYILPLKEDIWVGTEQGVFRVSRKNNTYQHYVSNVELASQESLQVKLSDDVVYNIFEDKNEVIWLGTQNGLTAYDPKTDEWETYGVKDGLAWNTIASIQAGDEDALWVSTYNGLSYFTPHREDSRSFFQIDGLSHNEFNRFSSLHTEDGRYYFGGVNGINAFYAEELLVSRDVPQVLLTSFSYGDSRLDSIITIAANLEDNLQIVIEPYYPYFIFDFALPIYTATADNQFRYRIGNDPEQQWIYLRGDRSLRYNDMKAGNYNIYVQGADPNGNWGKESLVINMLVKEAFHKRTWFWVLVGFLLLLFLYGMLRYRLEEKLRMERLRTQLASDLHDEVSGLLAGISLQSELLRSQIKEPMIDQKLENIRQASQRAMSKMSDVIWSIDSRRDRLSELIGRMEEHADEVLLPLGVRYQLKTEQLETDAAIPANIRQNVYFIYKEAINNVAKHAKAEQVDIWMGNRGNVFELLVKDDGKGSDEKENGAAKKRKTGQGLANLRMRAQRLNAELLIQNGQGFTIRLRMKKFI